MAGSSTDSVFDFPLVLSPESPVFEFAWLLTNGWDLGSIGLEIGVGACVRVGIEGGAVGRLIDTNAVGIFQPVPPGPMIKGMTVLLPLANDIVVNV